jgi:hypothetical protein
VAGSVETLIHYGINVIISMVVKNGDVGEIRATEATNQPLSVLMCVCATVFAMNTTVDEMEKILMDGVSGNATETEGEWMTKLLASAEEFDNNQSQYEGNEYLKLEISDDMESVLTAVGKAYDEGKDFLGCVTKSIKELLAVMEENAEEDENDEDEDDN